MSDTTISLCEYQDIYARTCHWFVKLWCLFSFFKGGDMFWLLPTGFAKWRFLFKFQLVIISSQFSLLSLKCFVHFFFEQHTFKWSIPPSTTILTIKKGLSMQGTFIESKLRDNANYVMRSWHTLDSFIWVEHQLPKIDFLMMKSFLLNKLCLNQTIKCMLNVASRGLVSLCVS